MDKQLKKIGEEMLSQSNRHTQFPLFIVQHEAEIWVDENQDYDRRERVDDYDESLYYCEDCEKLLDEDKELPEDCDDCGENCYNHYKIEKKLDTRAGVFLTAKACEQHIQENDYHYGKNAKSYAISAWRNSEMQIIMRKILETTGRDKPNYY